MNEQIAIDNGVGTDLAARLDHPAGQIRGFALFAHCFTCTKETLAAVRIAQELAMHGIGVLRVDFTGLGQSQGAFEETSFTSNINDLVKAAEWLEREYAAPQLLIGHSLGGAAVLAAASQIKGIKGVATVGAPAEPAHVAHLFDGAAEAIKRDGVAEVSIGGRAIRIGKGFVDDLAKHDPASYISNLRADLLVMHAPLDTIVGIENAAQIFSWAKHPKSFVSLDKADHLLTGKVEAMFAARVIGAWASRSLGDAVVSAKEVAGVARVRPSSDGLFAHDIAVGRHHLRADEPMEITGGLDTGPAPYDFLLSGLGACTAITIRMYADRKGWKLDDCHVKLTHEKREDGKGGKRDHFTRRISLDGELDEMQRKKILEIAEKCPVHLTLEKGSEVVSELE